MDSLMLHPLTLEDLKRAVSGGHHAIAIIGSYGAGKTFVAQTLAHQLLGENHAKSGVLHMAADSKAIGIEKIREMQSFLKLKTMGTQQVRRVVIIEDAEMLTAEAQNALLKTLEEPPHDTRILLTASSPAALKTTVLSRLQPIFIKPCNREQVIEYFTSSPFNYKQQEVEKAYFISGGSAGLCAALLSNKEHALLDAITEAKEFLLSSHYDRLLKVNVLAKERQQTILLLFALKRVLSAAANTNTEANKLISLGTKLKLVYEAERKMMQNVNAKLLLTNLAVRL